MAKKKAKAAYHYLPVYNRHLFMGNSVEAISSLLGEYYDVSKIDASILPSEDTVHGFVCPITDAVNEEITRAYVMYVKDGTGTGTLAHECAHLVNFIFDYVSVDLDACNDEAQAYLMGYLAQTYMELIRDEKPAQKPLEKLKKAKK